MSEESGMNVDQERTFVAEDTNCPATTMMTSGSTDNNNNSNTSTTTAAADSTETVPSLGAAADDDDDEDDDALGPSHTGNKNENDDENNSMHDDDSSTPGDKSIRVVVANETIISSLSYIEAAATNSDGNEAADADAAADAADTAALQRAEETHQASYLAGYEAGKKAAEESYYAATEVAAADVARDLDAAKEPTTSTATSTGTDTETIPVALVDTVLGLLPSGETSKTTAASSTTSFVEMNEHGKRTSPAAPPPQNEAMSSIMVAANAAAIAATANEFVNTPDTKRRRRNPSSKNKRHGVVGYLSWEDNFLRLQQFQTEFQTVNVPQNNDHPKNKNYSGLGNWVNHQRRRYRDGRLQREPEKIQKLDDIGFKWAQRPQKKAPQQQNKGDPTGKKHLKVAKQTAYMIYSNEIRERITKENPQASYGDVAKLISASYRNLHPNELADLEYKVAATEAAAKPQAHAHAGQEEVKMEYYEPPPPAEFEYGGEIHGI